MKGKSAIHTLTEFIVTSVLQLKYNTTLAQMVTENVGTCLILRVQIVMLVALLSGVVRNISQEIYY